MFRPQPPQPLTSSGLGAPSSSSVLVPAEASIASTASPSLLPSAASAGVRAMEETTVMIRIWFSSSGSSFSCGCNNSGRQGERVKVQTSDLLAER